MKVKLARVNTLLLIAILLVNAYVMLLPAVPAVSFWLRTRSASAETALANRIHTPATTTTPTYKENRLVVPAMLLDEPVYDGKDARTLNKGLWRRPDTSTPDKGGNTVISAHRFTYTVRHGMFYYLDKVQVGDELAVFWNGKRYLYRVNATKVVPATATEVEAPTDKPVSYTHLTLPTKLEV